MEKRIIMPRTRVELGNEPLLFLAGPIKGAPKWQDKSVEIIHSINEKIYIISPRSKLRKEYQDERTITSLPDFTYQLDFERNYLKLASESPNRAIMFWLPRQSETMPINFATGFPKPYARDTRPETAGWSWKLLEYNPNANVIVGGEENFDGFDVIRRNFLAVKPDMKFYSTLEETCQEATKLVTNIK